MILVVAGVGVLAVVGLGTLWLLTHAPATNSRAAAGGAVTAASTGSVPSTVSVTASAAPDVTPPASADTATAAAGPAQSAEEIASAKAANSSKKAVSRAAQPFPGARAISATTPSISQLKPRHKYVALTLDDGYNFQPEFLKLLEKYDAHCTTFLIGSWAASHKHEMKLMKKAGFEIGNHTWTHAFLTRLPSSQIQSQLRRTQKVISSVTGNQVPYLRPPYGDTDPHVKAAAAALGYRIVLWNRTFGDSGGNPTAARVTKTVTRNGGIKRGDVILCHWGSKGTYQALKKLLPKLKAKGYKFVTVSELIADSK